MESIVRDAIQHARDAAGSASPSKRMHELGVDMMVGLANGISDTEQKAIDAASEAIQKTIDQVGSALDKIRSKASSFSSTIRGGFSGFADIGGAFAATAPGAGTLSQVIQSQVNSATAFADVLEALKRQGASKGLLAQVAQSGEGFGQALLQGGPAQITQANEALKTIADLSRQTGKGLSEAFFGEKIGKLENRLDRLHDDLRELAELERRGHSHDIVVDGEKLATAVEKGIGRNIDRRGSAFNGVVTK
jgi:hypothetical protein